MTRAIRVGNGTDRGATSPESFWSDVLAWTEQFEPRKRMYGSAAAWCPRQNFLNSRDEFNSGLNVFPATAALYMSIGNGIEQALVDGLVRKERFIFNNLYLPKCEIDIGGKIDLVYVDDENEIAMAEVKSCGNLPDKPKPEHLAQLMTYAAIGGYDRCSLLYVSRNVRTPRGDAMLRVFPIEITEQNLLASLEKVCLSQLAIENGFVPEIPSNFSRTTTCRFCRFNDYCWNPEVLMEEERPSFVELNTEKYEAYKVRARIWAERLLAKRKTRYVAGMRHL